MRLGADSQRQFDQCGICLGRLIQPCAAPSGFLYCKECIIRNLLQQKSVIAEQRAAFEGQQLDLAREAEAKSTAAVLDSATAFARLEGGVGVTSSGVGSAGLGGAGGRSSGGEDGALRAAAAALRDRESGSHRVDQRDRADKTADAKRTSFWAAAAAPTAAAARLSAPDPHTRCPCSGEPLRAKQLVELHLTPASAVSTSRSGSGAEADDAAGADEDRVGGSSGAAAAAAPAAAASGGAGIGPGGRSFAAAAVAEASAAAAAAEVADGLVSGTCRFVCPSCLKGLTSQKVYAFTGCGHALCEGCTRQFVLPAKRCFECNMQVSDGRATTVCVITSYAPKSGRPAGWASLMRSLNHHVCDTSLILVIAPSLTSAVDMRLCNVSHYVQIKGKGEILALQQGGTSFAGHAGTVAEAAKWRPSLIS